MGDEWAASRCPGDDYSDHMPQIFMFDFPELVNDIRSLASFICEELGETIMTSSMPRTAGPMGHTRQDTRLVDKGSVYHRICVFMNLMCSLGDMGLGIAALDL